MRTGRPAFHIKARWISVDSPNGSMFFRLDDKGKLILNNGELLSEFRPLYPVNPQPQTVAPAPAPPAEETTEPMISDVDFTSWELDTTIATDIFMDFDFSLSNDISCDDGISLL